MITSAPPHVSNYTQHSDLKVQTVVETAKTNYTVSVLKIIQIRQF